MPLLGLFCVVSCCKYIRDLCWFARLFVRSFVRSSVPSLPSLARLCRSELNRE